MEISEILKDFSKQACIWKYIRRMKDDRNCYPALFELLFAKQLKDNWYEVGLQKENKLGNPVEIAFTDKRWKEYRVECKTSEIEPTQGTFSDKIIRKLTDIMKSMHMGLALNIVLYDDVDWNVMVDKIIMEVNSIIDTNKETLNNLSRPIKIKFTFWLLECFRFWYGNPTNTDIQDYFHKNSTEYRFESYVHKNKVQEKVGHWHPYAPIDDVARILWIKYNTKFSSKERKKRSKQDLTEDIRKKASQQKNLLETDCEVVIVLDKQYYEPFQKEEIDLTPFSKYKNLSIILCEYIADDTRWIIAKNYDFLLKSQDMEINPIV